ncbi:MAG TPA: hypothetical protein VF618_11895 [Thermoanaerobaculia bacterium]
MKRTATILTSSLLALTFVACATADRDSIKALELQNSATQRMAWERKDASLLANAADRAAIQQEMNATQSVKALSVDVVSIDVTGNEAVAVTNQKLVRQTAEGEKVSTYQQKQRYAKVGGKWQATGAAEAVAHAGTSQQPASK